MVCGSLTRACKSFKRECRMVNSVMLSDRMSPKQQQQQQNKLKKLSALHNQQSSASSSHSHCDQCSTAAIDIIILIAALGACGFLFTPYFKFVCAQVNEILPATLLFIGEVVYEAPVAYALAALITSVSVIGIWELYQYKSRKCGNPLCKGLKNAMECDIQLETEECVRNSPPTNTVLLDRGLQLAQDQKGLEAELRKIAPPNGRAVLVFRARCGCPAARFEVWGSKQRPRRSKK